MEEIVIQIGREMVKNKVPLEHAPESDLFQVEEPIVKEIKKLPEAVVHKKIVKAEQVDMFALLGI